MNKILEKCPVCEHDLIVTKVYCDHCGTTLSGQFGMTVSPINRLNQDQLDFLLTFIRCESKFNRMEAELGLSCPNIKSRFNEILIVMGFEAGNRTAKNQLSKDEQMDILQKLNAGEINPEEVDQLLREKE